MAKLVDLLAQIQAATGYVFHKLDHDVQRGVSLVEHNYVIYYRVSGIIRIDWCKILVQNLGQESEVAEFLERLPVILQPASQDSAWKTAVLAKKAALLAGDNTIKRIEIKYMNEDEKFALAYMWKLSAGKINLTIYFLYDVAGVLTSNEYSGTIVL